MEQKLEWVVEQQKDSAFIVSYDLHGNKRKIKLSIPGANKGIDVQIVINAINSAVKSDYLCNSFVGLKGEVHIGGDKDAHV